jgi:hypothetical protein
MNHLAPIKAHPAPPILIPQTEVIWHAPREFRNFMSTRRINRVAVLDEFVTGRSGMIEKRGVNTEFLESFERIEPIHRARMELLKKAETDPVSLIMPTKLWELTEEAAEIVGKSCHELLLLLAALEFVFRDQLSAAFADLRADEARKRAEATPVAAKVLAGPWQEKN